MSRVLIVLHPDGRVERVTVQDEVFPALQAAVGDFAERVSPAFHQLDTYEVWIDGDGAERLPLNFAGCRRIGFDTRVYHPLSGPIVLCPLPEGQTNRADRAHEAQFFGTLDAIAVGLATPKDLGADWLITDQSA